MTDRKRRCTLAALAATIVLVGEVAFGQESREVERIVAVTVFPDRAEITRELRAEVPAGSSSVIFSGIPLSIDPSSIRASAVGVPARLGSVEVDHAVAPTTPAEVVESARAEVARLEQDLEALNLEATASAKLERFVDRVAVAAVDSTGREGRPTAIDARALGEIYALIESRLASLTARDLARRRERQSLERQLERAKAELEVHETARSHVRRRVKVSLAAERGGRLDVRLRYVIANASWRPAYRADLDVTTGEVELVAEGVVRQSTGEPWNDVELHLSTATPARGLAPPELTPLVLRPVVPGAAPRLAAGAQGGAPDRLEEITVTARKRHSEFERVRSDPVSSLVAFDAELGTAPLSRAAYTGTFHVPARVTVPSDGVDHRIPLRSSTVEATLEHLVSHATGENAFLIAHTRTPDHPILPGELRVFADGGYLGSTEMKEAAGGAPLDIPFGIDSRLAVTRTVAPRSISDAGLLRKRREVVHAFRTRIENLTDTRRRVVVRDRVPVSEDSRLRVSIEDATTPDWKTDPDQPSIVEWILDLGPRETKAIELAYSLRVPPGVTLPELE